MIRIILVLLYPLLLMARVADAIAGRDPLRRREPDAASLWIERRPSTGDASYFLEASPAEQDRRGAGRWPEAVMAAVARWYAPPRLQPEEKFSAAADREQGIPDEMYTLW
jgi:hypothetical protein